MNKTRLVCDSCTCEIIITSQFIPDGMEITTCPFCANEEILLDDIDE